MRRFHLSRSRDYDYIIYAFYVFRARPRFGQAIRALSHARLSDAAAPALPFVASSLTRSRTLRKG